MLMAILSGTMEARILIFLNITSKSAWKLNSMNAQAMLVFLKLSASVMEVDMTDTSVSKEVDHIIELGLVLDTMANGTELMYSMALSIRGNLLLKQEKDSMLILMILKLPLTFGITLTLIGRTQ